jgi:hypothetical protein
MKIIKRYVPSQLSINNKSKQIRELIKSRKLYKRGIFYSRPKISSFKNKKSNHVKLAKKLYNIDSMNNLKQLSSSTGCSVKSLQKIISKGMGAYYSSGSRPSQTAHSWGIARLASSISSGKSAAVDYKILEKGCKKNSKALLLAKKAKLKYGTGTRKVPKIDIRKIEHS